MFEELNLLTTVAHLAAVQAIVFILNSKAVRPLWELLDKKPYEVIAKNAILAALYAGLALIPLWLSCEGIQLELGRECVAGVSFAQQAMDTALLVAAYAVSGKLLYLSGKAGSTITLEGAIGEIEIGAEVEEE